MKVVGLDGRSYNWRLPAPLLLSDQKGSSYHRRARELLKELFPLDRILEEVYLPGCELTADFVLLSRKLILEVNGQQHYQQSSLFHNTKLDFWRGQQNDQKKEEWALLNDFTFISLRYDESDERWRSQILGGSLDNRGETGEEGS